MEHSIAAQMGQFFLLVEMNSRMDGSVREKNRKEGQMEEELEGQGGKEGQTKPGYWSPKMVSESLREEKIQIKIFSQVLKS